MLDPKFIRSNPELVREGLAKKDDDTSLGEFLRLDESRRRLLTETESLKATLNSTSKEIGTLKKSGQDASSLMAEMAELREKIRVLDEKVAEADGQLDYVLLRMPNLPHESVPVGPDATANEVVRTWGEPRSFSFEAKPHWELAKETGSFEFERATKITGVGGVGFPLLKGSIARLTRGLMNFFLDLHTSKHGYSEVWAPAVASRASMTGTTQIPKFEDDMYHISRDDLFLIPTAEVPLTNFHREEILEAEQLPIFLTGYTPCFRREAGAAGKDTRGLLRVHQFDKVELVKFVKPEESYDHLESLTRNAEECLQLLELPYRVLLLSTGDMTFGSAKTYDLEVHSPGVNQWLEVSSCTNFEAFQARRAGIRYRPQRGAKPEFVHTLNGSGLAFPRIISAILENNQREDRSVTVPCALRPYMGGLETI
jgi:seryl-tRNA synthetase